MPIPDPDGQVSLMLCESILHILVEEGVISNEKALEAIHGVIELARENEIGQRPSASRSAVQLIEAIAQTFALKGLDEVTSFTGPCCTDRSLGGEDWRVNQGPVPDPGQPPCRSKRTKIAVITSRSSGTE